MTPRNLKTGDPNLYSRGLDAARDRNTVGIDVQVFKDREIGVLVFCSSLLWRVGYLLVLVRCPSNLLHIVALVGDVH